MRVGISDPQFFEIPEAYNLDLMDATRLVLGEIESIWGIK